MNADKPTQKLTLACAKAGTSGNRGERLPELNGRIDFAAVNRAVLPSLSVLLPRWLPDGKIVGHEYIARNPTRADKSPGSFKIAISGARAGRWADFATGECGGDVVSLCAYLDRISQAEAARRLASMLRI